jgi:DNA-binding transcriptional regulator YiaG
MYHYKDSGLDNAWLENGYTIHDTPYGEAVSIKDVDGLHRVIAAAIIAKPGRLTAQEFRFLRIELDLAQKRLGELIGAEEQAVARWERGITPVPAMADRLLRAFYREHADGNAKLREMAERLNELDEREPARITLKRGRNGWKLAAYETAALAE